MLALGTNAQAQIGQDDVVIFRMVNPNGNTPPSAVPFLGQREPTSLELDMGHFLIAATAAGGPASQLVFVSPDGQQRQILLPASGSVALPFSQGLRGTYRYLFIQADEIVAFGYLVW